MSLYLELFNSLTLHRCCQLSTEEVEEYVFKSFRRKPEKGLVMNKETNYIYV